MICGTIYSSEINNKKFKNMKIFLDISDLSDIINNVDAELCKGSTADSDSVCLGSNPSSAATKASNFYSGLVFFRGVAQFGSALRSGRRGRRFESCHLDQKQRVPFGTLLFFIYKIDPES